MCLLEKDHHPRFHIGESLLPMNLSILERLGVLGEVRKIGIVKHASVFVPDRYTGNRQVFRFSKAMNAACLGAEPANGVRRNPGLESELIRRYENTVRRGFCTMSWFVYRFTITVLHHMFMQPSNRFRMEQADISMLSGDVFEKSPVFRSLAEFKMLYYLFTLICWHQSLSVYIGRRKGNRRVFIQETLLNDSETLRNGGHAACKLICSAGNRLVLSH